VDDARDLRHFVARLFAHAGHRVVEADCAADALRLLAAGPLPDLVITDVMMPGMDGIEMLRAMRRDPRTAGVPVIVFSALDDARRIAAALADGATAYWVKGDVEPEQMFAEVDRVVALGRAAVPPPIGHEPAPRRAADPDRV
jgi:CheY-like chemotaxis protein